jgi:hypothetical protein
LVSDSRFLWLKRLLESPWTTHSTVFLRTV